MRYPQTFIDDLKRQADIVRVIQDYVQLKKKGANWMACCPFHKEKTPSFSVSPAKEIFYCFGCHKGGSVFNFVMEIERVAFPEAIRIVADKIGVPLPKLVEDSRFEARRHEADDVIELNSWALDWWQQQLESSKEARIARDYLVQRELSEETQKTFRLGYAPDSWDALSTYLRQKGATQQQIERSGLVVKKEDTPGSYDRFRGRLMFPVLDAHGRAIAFGGRALKPDDNAKYINSPETAAYIKGRNLFGLNLTRDEIRRQGFAILVEGFLDLIVPYQSGVRNVAASLGTALTAEQAKLLSRFARKVVVNYDGDRAGVQAARKSIEILLAEDIEVKVLVLPDNADPDEFIRKFGVTEYQRRRAQAQPHIQFVIENALRDRNLHRPADKAEAVEEVLPYIRAVSSRIQKREYFDMAMDSLGIDRDNVNTSQWRRELWQAVRDNRPTRSSAAHAVAKEKKVTAAEQRLLGLLLADADLRHQVLPMLKKEDYEDLATAPLFEALIALDREGTEIDFDALIRKTEGDDFAASVVPMVMMDSSLHGSNEHYVPEKCVSTFRLMKTEHRIEELRRELAIAEREQDSERVSQLSTEQIQLATERKLMLTLTEEAAK
ncbi:MAG TPA: DNA primase [Pyrinomonadaceae bacterium]|jgi:DNA primase|nr:DNA primase [Pyrinomonadaceae bacterium]